MKSNKQFTTFVKSVERSNTKFQQANRHQKIVMVSKDVLMMLELKRIKAQTGTYVEIPAAPGITLEKDDAGFLTYTDSNDKCSVQDILKMPELPACTVCAIGGAMLGTTLRLNKVNADKLSAYHGISMWYGHDMLGTADTQASKRANSVFGTKLLRYMEEAFESNNYGYVRLSTHNRLIAIYQNLIDNKGKRFTWYKDKTRVVFEIKGSK
jgi:hypothetical protein